MSVRITNCSNTPITCSWCLACYRIQQALINLIGQYHQTVLYCVVEQLLHYYEECTVYNSYTCSKVLQCMVEQLFLYEECMFRSCSHSTAQRCWWAVSRVWNSVIQWTPLHFKPLTSKLLHYQEPIISSSQVLLKSIDLVISPPQVLAGVWGVATHTSFSAIASYTFFSFDLHSRFLGQQKSLSLSLSVWS